MKLELEFGALPKVSELDAADIVISKHVRECALKEKWNQVPVEVEALLRRERYQKLYELLSSGRVEIRVVPKDHVFVHGKAADMALRPQNVTQNNDWVTEIEIADEEDIDAYVASHGLY